MTGPEDTHSDTRPISVAELLARNGTIGAPPVGGRRRRRRGDTGSISVAELTGEIPIVTGHDVADDDTDTKATTVELKPDQSSNGHAEPEAELRAEDDVEEAIPEVQEDVHESIQEGIQESTEQAATTDVEESQRDTDIQDAVADVPETTEDEYADAVDAEAESADDAEDDEYAAAVSDYASHMEQRDSDADLDFFAPPRRSSFAPRKFRSAAVDAEEMSPDPLVDVDEDVLEAADADLDDDADDADAGVDLKTKSDDLPSYLRSSSEPLFGGQTVADDVARRGTKLGPEDIDLGDDHRSDLWDDLDGDLDEDVEKAPSSAWSSFKSGAWVVGQCVLAVAFGAGLFIAFDQLWKWNNIVALVLSVLVILGLVVGVRVVRKTEDIGSTLIAVAVGALVTLGPLALLQSG